MPDFNQMQRQRLASRNQATPDHNDYIRHYGVLGMKWGVRRSEKALERAARHRRNAEDYDSKQSLVKLSDKQRAKMTKNRNKELALAKKEEQKAKDIENKHRSRAGDNTYERVKSTSTAKLLGQSWLTGGTYGALKYNQARAEGASRGKAWVEGFVSNFANNVTMGALSVVEPRTTASKRNKR